MPARGLETLHLLVDRTRTPIGELVVIADGDGRLRALDWTDHEARLMRLLRSQYGKQGFSLDAKRNPGGLTMAMDAYFTGDLGIIDRLPVETAGTDFQREVWKALRRIPCGSTITYAALAKRIGRPRAIRAAGAANGANPVSIVVPCHRVIGTNGALTGYGGGIERKRWLLAHEGARVLDAGVE